MKRTIGKLKSEIEILEDRVKAKEAILKCVFSSLEYSSSERQMVRKVLGVSPKVSCSPCHISLNQNWCVGFEDTVCVSFNASNFSNDSNVQAACYVLTSGSVIKCVLLDESWSCIPFIRSNSCTEMLVGFSKAVFFSSSCCSLMLEFTHHSLAEKYSDNCFFTYSVLTRQRLPVETHGIAVKLPLIWYSFADFLSAKEQDMRLLLRCLRVSSYVYSLKPSSSIDFAEANPDFCCCDYGAWQVFVGRKSMEGLVATSSAFDHPNANIDRVYGLNTQLLDAFALRSKS